MDAIQGVIFRGHLRHAEHFSPDTGQGFEIGDSGYRERYLDFIARIPNHQRPGIRPAARKEMLAGKENTIDLEKRYDERASCAPSPQAGAFAMCTSGRRNGVTMPVPECHSKEWAFPLLGMDVSEKRIGLAISDNPAAPAQPMFTYLRITRARDLLQCAEWVRRYGIGTVVLGLPLNMDGSPGPRAQWMRRFARELQERITVPVVLQDERLSTVEAEELLQQSGLSREARADRVDAVAAALILQRFCTEGPSRQPEENPL